MPNAAMPEARIRHEYQTALAEITRRIAASLVGVAPQALPIRM